jgi:hypothetical protein
MSVAEFNAELMCAFRGQNPACLLHLHLKEDYEEWIMLKFLAGLVCGAGVGLLIAPTSGENIRRRLAQAARDPEQLARDTVTNIREKAGDMGANLGRQAAQKAVDQMAPEKFNQPHQRSG